jgi:hypothetical protein
MKATALTALVRYRWGRRRRTETFRFTEGTLVVNLMDTDGRELVWRGILPG